MKSRAGRPMAYWGDLTRLSLAAIESALEFPSLSTTDVIHGTPKISSRRGVRRILHHLAELPIFDPIETLRSKLKIEALHIDRPGLVAYDIETIFDICDQIIRIPTIQLGC